MISETCGFTGEIIKVMVNVSEATFENATEQLEVLAIGRQ
jgi:hypothetical protein